jgi:hypothetical protein
MSTPKPVKESSSVKFSNKTGGAYADIKDVIQSERENWNKPSNQDTCKSTNGNKETKQDHPAKR